MRMTPEPPEPVKPAALPLVALIVAVVGFCLPPLIGVALVLAIVSLAKASEPAYAARKTLAILTLVFSLAYVPVVGILAAIAIPNFIKYQARAKQQECKIALKGAFTAEKAHYAEHDLYSDSPEVVGFAPDGARYTYRFSRRSSAEVVVSPQKMPAETAAALDQAIPQEVLQSLGLSGQCPNCDITIACVGNVDNDKTVDVWTISTADRAAGNGEPIRAGVPYNDLNDLDN